MISYEVHFDLAAKNRRVEEISHLETEETFWQDNKKAKVLSQEKSRLESEVNNFNTLERAYDDAQAMFDLAQEAKDDELLGEAADMIVPMALLFEKAEMQKMLSDPQDPLKYDFPLCHLGISGRCPLARNAQACRACPLLGECLRGRALTRA